MGRNETIRVAHLISGDLWAGAEVQAYTMIGSLARANVLELSAIILNHGKLADLLKEAGIRVTVIDERQHGFFGLYRAVGRELTEHPVDILHSHRYKENILAAMVKGKGSPKRLVQTVHGTTELFAGVQGLKIGLYNRLNRFVTRRSFDRILPVSFDIEHEFRRRYDARKLTTVHNAVDMAKVGPSRTAELVRREWGISPDYLVVGTVGRMAPVKNYELFLESVRLIRKRNPQVVFVLAGDGPEKGRYETLARDLGLGEAVKFLGFRHDVWDVLNALDLFVMTSHHEGIPVVLLEGMTLGKACVCTAVGGIGEVIEPGQSGALTPPGNAPAMAEACLGLLEDPAERQRMGEAARRRIAQEFSADRQRERLLTVYQEVLERI